MLRKRGTSGGLSLLDFQSRCIVGVSVYWCVGVLVCQCIGVSVHWCGTIKIA